jgi:hypothetical protein
MSGGRTLTFSVLTTEAILYRSIIGFRYFRQQFRLPNHLFPEATDFSLHVALVIDTSDSGVTASDSSRRGSCFSVKPSAHPPIWVCNRIQPDVQVAQEPAHDMKALNTALKRFHPGGETAVYDAVITAAHQIVSIHEAQSSVTPSSHHHAKTIAVMRTY